MNFKLWINFFCVVSFLLLLFIMSVVIIIDPFFHFSRPNEKIFYNLDFDYERYLNNGILRHFSYDAIITGTSMTENFKVSEAENILGGKVIKVPFAGGGFEEINDNLKRAFKYNNNIEYVIRSLDYTYLIEKPKHRIEEQLPEYLYNDNFYDDIFYVLNKDALVFSIKCVKNTLEKGGGITGFDEYGDRTSSFKFGANNVLNDRNYYSKPVVKKGLTEDKKIFIYNNVYKNVIDLAQNHPETTFYYFFPPYSMAYYGELYEKGELEVFLEAEKIAIEIILNQSNIKLFSFGLNKKIVTDLNNYADSIHYSGCINTQILYWMKNDVGRISKENYKQYIHDRYKLLMNYDYNQLFKQKSN